MPTYPSPFIGGSENPRRDTSGRDILATPFHPEDEVELAQPSEAAQTAAEELELPDYLSEPEAEGESEGLPAEVIERLARVAHQLLDGEQGGWIRVLIADLSSLSTEIAVPRAFAAGYLAAKDEASD